MNRIEKKKAARHKKGLRKEYVHARGCVEKDCASKWILEEILTGDDLVKRESEYLAKENANAIPNK